MLARSARWPVTYAVLLATSYGIFFTAYIVISSQIALNIAADAVELKKIETIKGILYGVFSSGLLFVGSWLLFRRIASDAVKLKSTQEATALAERHAVTGLLTMAIAHDCNNLVVILTNSLQMLEQDVGSQTQIQPHIGRIDSSLKALREMLTRLHRSGREIAIGQAHVVAIDRVIEDAVEIAKNHHSRGASTVSVSIEAGLQATGFTMLIQQMLINLVINAFEATKGKGVLKVTAWQENPWVVIEVHDNGPGIPQAIRESLFEPYYTTKKDGMGLGLVSVRACVDSNKGILSITDSPLGGACFRIKIPLTEM